MRRGTEQRLPFTDDDTLHVYRDMRPLECGERFHDQAFINRAAMRLIVERCVGQIPERS